MQPPPTSQAQTGGVAALPAVRCRSPRCSERLPHPCFFSSCSSPQLYHIVNDTLRSNDIAGGQILTTVGGAIITVGRPAAEPELLCMLLCTLPPQPRQ